MLRADLSGQIALVVGSTKGVGKAIAVKFAENGADVVVTGRHPETAADVMEKIEQLGRRVIFEQADITNYQSVDRMVNNVLEKFGKIDILVASGGNTFTGVPVGVDFFRNLEVGALVDRTYSQYFSRIFCAKAVLEHMIQRQQGRIIFITTDAGRFPTPGEIGPGGSAAAVILATKVLAAELARWGIRVNSIGLTVLSDAFNLDQLADMPTAHVFRKALQRQPFKVTSNHIAETALFFASDASDGITGQVLSVNGGLSFPG